MTLSSSLVNKRIRLLHTDDQYTELKHGDMGTITDVDKLPDAMGGQRQIWVKWDSVCLAMSENHDIYGVLDKP